MTRPDYARLDVKHVMVPALRGTATIVTSIAPGTDSVEYIECECPQAHSTVAAAERCIRKLVAVRNPRRVRGIR